MDVHCFPHPDPQQDEWVVRAGADEQRFASRAEAFDVAKALLRANPPGRMVREQPAGWVAAPAPPVAPPEVGADLDGAAAPEPVYEQVPVDAYEPWFEDEPEPEPAGEGWYEDEPPRAARASGASGVSGSSSSGSSSSGWSRGSQPSRSRVSAPSFAPPTAQPYVRRADRPAVPADWHRLAGPDPLGRAVVLRAGAAVPEPWHGCPVVAIGHRDGPTGAALLETVRDAFLGRHRVVYEVHGELEAPLSSRPGVDVWSLSASFELEDEAARHLLLLNAVDALEVDRPVWPWAERAVEGGATAYDGGGPGDIELPDGTVVLCDGGPLHFFPAEVMGAPVLPRVMIERRRFTIPSDAPPTAALAEDQLEAVRETGARARIIAPAGSGKTRVLTERARYLLGTKAVPPDALTLVAFNKRAQEEMKDRTQDLPALQVQTLNALALAVLNGGHGFRSRGVRMQTIDELQVRRMLSDMVKFPRRANTDPAAAWIDALSQTRLGLRSPRDVEAEFNGDVDGFAAFFPEYRRALQRANAVDFDDQIYAAIEVLLAEPETRHHAQQQCRLLMVDEFQDLTPAHLLLIRLLAGPDLDVFGVGDDDQTIYGYSGASPDWLIDFDTYFPGATHHALHVNYRCPAPVVTAASNLLSRNGRRVVKEIHPGPANVVATDALEVLIDDEPVATTAARVAELVQRGVAPSDIAVLTRVNTLLAPVQVALHGAGIPVANKDSARFLERTGVAAALSWLSLAARPNRLGSANIQRAARRPGRGLSPKLIEWMGDQKDPTALRRLAGRLNTERDAEKVEAFVGDLERIARLADTAPTARILEFVRNEVGLDRAMQTLDAAHRGRNATAHSDDLRALIALGRLHPDAATFGSWLRDALSEPSDDQGVVLSTVHKVKGLEWPHVIVHDATANIFPHRLSLDIEEERRVFHVAITRGQQSVTVVADAEDPSLFLAELQRAGAPTATRPPTSAVGKGAAAKALPEIAAVVGLEVAWGGYEGTLSAVEADHAVLAVDRASLALTFGSEVTVDGRTVQLVAPTVRSGGSRARGSKGAAPDAGDADAAVLEALKAWRLDRSKTDAVPAFVVAADKVLIEIATTKPTSPEALLGISGIGPAKLERYGDEILAVIDEAIGS